MARLFQEKWCGAVSRGGDERDLFVPPGAPPRTQRQFNLFHYHRFISGLIEGGGFARAAEFGCGRGTISQYLTVHNGIRMTLVDTSEDALALARANFANVGAQAEFVCADAVSSGLPSDSYDLVLSIGLLEHIPDYRTVLREKFRILKPGGLMFSMNVPGKRSVQNLNDIYKKIIAPFAPAGSIRKDYYRNNDRPEQYLAAAREAGFDNCSVMNVNPYPIFTPVPPAAERTLTALYRGIHRLRGLLMKEPMATNYPMSQAHFLIGYKPAVRL
ncbi:hypothetical protein A3D72_01115 [Candidatus Uhrbacteria bacterium RIFCSPHIGHO2_02_FULL_57_19]|uniref:Methyltransferase type 11 domain-containing protein n=1 Tax=Candidatus Uhrbacteria bacterium RIFCSPHIGHO2_02_FULL_57_19 TaxID=1802391 RepID=A0A1F7U2E3_9BACT|nr:MAG: hypothetical protein A3D72_01115 [Candidatus Uhrbacteria bacterium RIFCSPHIGHO2_02_FULL_57_19]